ncbi:hypothetical protein JVX93_19060 [Mycolicibacterium boenickei]|nr:hypothetical protein JVX93_19060 [Mycolicibacterium boenickei]
MMSSTLGAEVFLERMGLPLSNADDIVATRLLSGKLNASNDVDGKQLAVAIGKVHEMFSKVVADRRRRRLTTSQAICCLKPLMVVRSPMRR